MNEDKDMDNLVEETNKAIEDLNAIIAVALLCMAVCVSTIIGTICLLFLDMAPVLRIIWMVILFGYLGISLMGIINKLVKTLKTKSRIKSTLRAIKMMQDISGSEADKDC